MTSPRPIRSALVTGCVARLVEIDLTVEAPEVAAAPPEALVDALVGVAVAMATSQRHRTLARYELVEGGDTVRRLAARTLAAAGASDPGGAAAELAALLDGLVFTAMLRGPHEPVALAAWVRSPIQRAVHAWTGGRVAS